MRAEAATGDDDRDALAAKRGQHAGIRVKFHVQVVVAVAVLTAQSVKQRLVAVLAGSRAGELQRRRRGGAIDGLRGSQCGHIHIRIGIATRVQTAGAAQLSLIRVRSRADSDADAGARVDGARWGAVGHWEWNEKSRILGI